MRPIHIGTSGYAYKEWKGNFYPQKLPAAKMLAYYGERFSTVEINNTFYRMPKTEMLEGWLQQVPDAFTFILKAPQRITHIKRLNDVADTLEYFFKISLALGKKRGPTLFQLPPNFKKNIERLHTFLTLIPASERVAFEFRHASWFDDSVYELLKAHNVALCIADVDATESGSDVATPHQATANWGYVRLRRKHYTTPQLKKWASWLTEQAWQDAFVFLKHEDGGKGPAYADTLRGLL